MQNYNIRKRDGKEAAPTRAFQDWIDELNKSKAEVLMPALSRAGALLPDSTYNGAQAPTNEFLMEVSDFNTLIAISQDLAVPVFEIPDKELGVGTVETNQQRSRERFGRIYQEGAEKVIKLVEHADELMLL